MLKLLPLLKITSSLSFILGAVSVLKITQKKGKRKQLLEDMSEKIGDCVVDEIYSIGDRICAPFDWMTSKIIRWM